MKLKIEIKNRFTGKILFEFETQENTVKKTLIEALKRGADLRGAYLRGEYLSDVDLRGADLSDVDFSGAVLRDADFRGADFRGAVLSGSDFRGADFRGSDLRGAVLSGAYFRGAYFSGAYFSGSDLRGAYLRGEKIKYAAFFTGLYEYIVIPFVTENGEKRIIMGCHNRSEQEWIESFWNNNNEFPNDGSLKSECRVMGFKTAQAWFQIIDKTTTAV